MSDQSDTPRTDAAVWSSNQVDWVAFARQLERELAEAKEQIYQDSEALRKYDGELAEAKERALEQA